MGTRFYGCHHTTAILIPLKRFGCRLKVLKQQHWSKWVWNGSCEKDVGRITGADLFF
jgi:hypothetical protein